MASGARVGSAGGSDVRRRRIPEAPGDTASDPLRPICQQLHTLPQPNVNEQVQLYERYHARHPLHAQGMMHVQVPVREWGPSAGERYPPKPATSGR
jgi:hypothetical protein